MHIAFLVQDIEGKSGWSRYARDLSKAIADQGHTVTVLVESAIPDAHWCRQIVCLRPPLHCLHSLGAIRQAWLLWRCLRKETIDVIHVISEPYAIALVMVPLCTPFLITIHGSYAVIPFTSGCFIRRLTKRAYRCANRIIAVSHFTKKYVHDNEPSFFRSASLEQKIVVVQNAITIDSNTSIINRGTKEEPIKMIIGVGAVKKRKGYVQAVQALAFFKKKYNIPFRYRIIGSSADVLYTEKLQAVIQSFNLQAEVQICGAIEEEELVRAYEEADLFLLLSLAEKPYVEGFVLGFLEAAARGIPCIGPTTGGCPEAIHDGVTGYSRDPYNAEKVADAIAHVLKDDLIDRHACRAWAEAHNIQDTATTIEELYRSAVS